MTIRKFAPKTQHDYVQRVKNFAAFLGRSPDMGSFEDVRRYQLHLVSSGAGVPKPLTTSDMAPLTIRRRPEHYSTAAVGRIGRGRRGNAHLRLVSRSCAHAEPRKPQEAGQAISALAS
nr:hypothetical protein [Bradyrhizobium campsiandrae]